MLCPRERLEAIARLTHAGYRIAVATNQSGIARGLLDTRTLFAIHDTLLRALAREKLPAAVWDRPKHGFSVPLSIYFNRTGRAKVERNYETNGAVNRANPGPPAAQARTLPSRS